MKFAGNRDICKNYTKIGKFVENYRKIGKFVKKKNCANVKLSEICEICENCRKYVNIVQIIVFLFHRCRHN